MSTTLVEQEEEHKQRDTGHMDPEWEAWAAMDVPCIVEGCNDEVEWWGNQHGCVKGPMCDNHMWRWINRLRADFSLQGWTGCNYCAKTFDSLEKFFKAVRI